ncbi:hypothetical protein MKQ70_06990 [Chitinophaga sedimenti]|uniref:hypothetical protein n=1 Tax=Chitinophaga sedimenti TaxID=2033606 RepID=UPI0020053872|nr:hypothetical protein [Chitinophaga sedimenti]MCK7554759.1 hypothetical protein [Chitinophaga sedimenti]
MEPAYWQYNASSVDFITQDGLKAAHLKDGMPFIPKNLQFANGTIEYDVALKLGFPGISFRISKDGKSADQFYLRYFGSTSPERRTTIQYAAIVDSMSMWDMTDEYQGGAKLNIPGWNHVKLVVSGKQLKAYVNNMTRPALLVPMLEGSEAKGGLAFSGGDVTITNFIVRPDVTEGLDPAPGYVPPYNDTRYLRNWQVNKPNAFPFGREVAAFLPGRGMVRAPEYPDSTASWTPVWAGPRGIVNLTRALGATPFGQRRLAWIKTTIASATAQEHTLQLGFSDEIWLFVNGDMVLADKNLLTHQDKSSRKAGVRLRIRV